MMKWHRKQTEYWQKKFNVDSYGLAWIAWAKGLVMGVLIAWFIFHQYSDIQIVQNYISKTHQYL